MSLDETYIMSNGACCLVLLLVAFSGISPGVTLRTAYTKKPLLGYRCVMDDPYNLMTFTHTARPQCVWRCLSLCACMVVSHNGLDDTCELAMQRCDRLQGYRNFSVNIYGIDRSKCTHWVSKTLYDAQKAISFQQKASAAYKIAVARLVLNTGVYPGKNIRFLNHGIYVAVSATEIRASLSSGQVLHLSPTCQPAWIPYPSSYSNPLSRIGAVVGGRIGNEDVYVARAHFGPIYNIGYYRLTSQLGYFFMNGKANATADDLEILMLV